jgi:hypothetical protein
VIRYFIVLASLVSSALSAQDIVEVRAESKITDVTVYLQNAQITRSAKSKISVGTSKIIFKDLSPYIDEKSVQVKGEGAFKILSVKSSYNFLNKLNSSQRKDSIENAIQKIDFNLTELNNRKLVLKEKFSLLNENKNIGGANTGPSLDQLKNALEFYDREISLIKSEELKINEEVNSLNVKRVGLEKQSESNEGKNQTPSGEIIVEVESKSNSVGVFQLSYVVSQCGWFPNYDIRVTDITKPVSLTYKADVFQNTGVNWSDVKLKFSNSNPNQTGTAPKLAAWYLNYPRYMRYEQLFNEDVRQVSGRVVSAEGGEGLPGVNVVVKGSTIGTVTDLQGNYNLSLPENARTLVFSFIGLATEEVEIGGNRVDVSMQDDVKQLSEVVSTGFAKNKLQGRASGISIRGNSSLNYRAENIVTSTVENQTTVEFEIEKAYTVRSNNEKQSVQLKQYSIDAVFEYYAVPKVDNDAFLIARIINWGKYNFLEGEASLYFEDGYVGRSILNAKSLKDTLDISMGRDKSIVLGRTKVDDYSKKKTIGSNKIESRGYEIFIKNNKSSKINISVLDQIPHSINSDISVTPTELSGAILDKDKSEIKWNLELSSGESKKLIFGYEVKYPRKEQILLE